MEKFADLLNRIYFTYSHLGKTRLLHLFFAQTPDPERGYALAIMAGTLEFPTFKRALIKELLEDKIDPILFELSYDYVGDMSETIALLWPDSTCDEQLPLLSELILAFNQQNALAPKSMKHYLSYLLDNSNTIERWALLKLGTGSLRIGISARFLKNALATYGQVNVEEIEHLWHGLYPPYTELFAWLEKKKTIPVLQNSIYFHPVMLSHPLDEKELQQINWEQFAFERKYDGIRVQFVSTVEGKALFTRTGENISASFPDVLSSIQGDVVLDGELVILTAHGVGSFNELQQRLNRKTLPKKLLLQAPAGIILYDILKWNNEDLRNLPFMARRQKLEHWKNSSVATNILLSDILIKEDTSTLLELKQKILQENHPAVEGLMIKHKQSPYIAGRPKGHWYKWKRSPLLVDAVLMYAQRGHGKRSSYYSDYTFGLWKEAQLLPIGKAYFGFTDEELKKLDRWIRHNTIQRFGPVREVKKELVFEIAFDAVNLSARHKSGVALRFPRINRIRWDKPAEEADQLVELINLIN
jgi:DNA ligase-1